MLSDSYLCTPEYGVFNPEIRCSGGTERNTLHFRALLGCSGFDRKYILKGSSLKMNHGGQSVPTLGEMNQTQQQQQQQTEGLPSPVINEFGFHDATMDVN